MFILPEIEKAIKENRPVVALESTIISHGMPYPENFKTAIEVEDIIRKNGAIPATIAILDGIIRIGLDRESLERLAQLGPKNVRKVSRRDIPSVIALKQHGATTVSATMALAHMSGISIFVTGGIGGVHRGATQSMDVSADLTELGRTPVAVVCAGAKSILDIGLTLEYLETQGVPVVGYETKEFPAFFTRHSGFETSDSVNNPKDCAKIVNQMTELNLKNGMLIAVPIPEKYEAQGALIEQATQQALKESEQQKVSGKDITPFLLKRINEITKGESLKANISLVKNNAETGAKIAVELSNIRVSSHNLLVFGGAVLDCVGHEDKNEKNRISAIRSSHPGFIKWSLGGVARNIAEVVHRCGGKVSLISGVGDDDSGRKILDHSNNLGIHTNLVIKFTNSRTGIWLAIVDQNGELVTSIADMSIFELITPNHIEKISENIKMSPMVFVDCNLSSETINKILTYSRSFGVPNVVNTVSVEKSARICSNETLQLIDLLTPNTLELLEIASKFSNKVNHSKNAEDLSIDSILDLILVILNKGVKHIVVTCGHRGVIYGRLVEQKVVYEHFPALPVEKVINTNGAGDSFVGGLIASLLINNKNKQFSSESILSAIKFGLEAAKITIQSEKTIPEELNRIRNLIQGKIINSSL
eukprot:c17703_g1_i1.p1 GENE.c17703_g1_i1~~c17703_g1_i1.p1  ORF type:complete len:655 (+),score=275.52 c17703_g1_i1:25-1965(+)